MDTCTAHKHTLYLPAFLLQFQVSQHCTKVHMQLLLVSLKNVTIIRYTVAKRSPTALMCWSRQTVGSSHYTEALKYLYIQLCYFILFFFTSFKIFNTNVDSLHNFKPRCTKRFFIDHRGVAKCQCLILVSLSCSYYEINLKFVYLFKGKTPSRCYIYCNNTYWIHTGCCEMMNYIVCVKVRMTSCTASITVYTFEGSWNKRNRLQPLGSMRVIHTVMSSILSKLHSFINF